MFLIAQKTYAYTTTKGKQVGKCKGFTLNKLASDPLTLEIMKHLVTADQDSISVTLNVIRGEAKRLRVYTEEQTKVYTCTLDKRVRQPNHTSIPYGCRLVENTQCTHYYHNHSHKLYVNITNIYTYEIIHHINCSCNTINNTTMLFYGCWKLEVGSGKTYFTKSMLNQRVKPDFVRYTSYTPNDRMAN